MNWPDFEVAVPSVVRKFKPNVDHKKFEMLRWLASQQIVEECQVWPGTIDVNGYGRVWVGGRWRLAHHVMHEVICGPLAEGMTLDHYLMNVSESCSKSCVNLFHLEAVPNVVNVMRSKGACALHARQTHCKRGHEFTPENTYRRPGHTSRECHQCRRAYGPSRRASLANRSVQ